MATTDMMPVLIVGAGPTGMTAAMELSRFGIPVRLVEQRPAPETTSRAIGVQARTLELLEQRGLAADLLKVGNPGVAASIYGGGKRVIRLDFAHIDSRYNYLFFVSQAETERVLREELARRQVAIERGVTLVALGQPAEVGALGAANPIAATLRHPDGTLEEVEAAYLISAEGAHSLVRGTLGLPFQGETHPESYALADLHLDGDLAEHDFYIFSSEYGFMGLFPMGQQRWRLIASHPLSKPSKDTAPELAEIQEIYDMRAPIPVKFRDMSWSSWFHINCRMTATLQDRGIFLGGDAAHIHSPAGAQGMNTGIQDMINLSWKLAWVMQGRAAPALLDTYSADRIPVIRNVLTKTDALTEAIGITNPVFRAVFNHVAPLVVDNDFIQTKSTTRMSQIGLNYRDSPLSEGHWHTGGLHAGDRVPDMPVQVLNPAPGAAALLSLLDPSQLTLLFVNGADAAALRGQLAPWQAQLRVHQVGPAADDDAAHQHFTDTFGTTPGLVLVRPDGYVGFLGSATLGPQLVAYLNKWFPPTAPADKSSQPTFRHAEAQS